MEKIAQTTLLLNAKEAADYLRVSLSTLSRMEARGELSALRTPGGHRRYTLEILNGCLRSPLPKQLFTNQDNA